MAATTYSDFWDTQASTAESAISAVDGSQSEDVVQHTGRWSAAQVRAALDITPEDDVLELGCGIGRIGRELAERCRSWTGVDISANMIRHASKRLAALDNVRFHHLQRSSLEMLEDDSVDKAYSIAVFCHMDKEDLYLYMLELFRVVRPGGIIFVETWNLTHPVGWRRWVYEPMVWSRSDQSRRKDVARNQFCTEEEFGLYVTQAGFELLASFGESQSVQVIAGKQLDAPRKAGLEARIDRHRDQIAYSPVYAELFAQSVDVLFGQLPPQDMLEYIDGLGDASEARLFRPYLLSLWQKNAALWGDPPG
jgi:SAM-dependent methyltransferase